MATTLENVSLDLAGDPPQKSLGRVRFNNLEMLYLLQWRSWSNQCLSFIWEVRVSSVTEHTIKMVGFSQDSISGNEADGSVVRSAVRSALSESLIRAQYILLFESLSSVPNTHIGRLTTVCKSSSRGI